MSTNITVTVTIRPDLLAGVPLSIFPHIQYTATLSMPGILWKELRTRGKLKGLIVTRLLYGTITYNTKGNFVYQ